MTTHCCSNKYMTGISAAASFLSQIGRREGKGTKAQQNNNETTILSLFLYFET